MIVCGGLLVPPEPTLTCCLDLSPAGLIRVVSPFDAVTQSQLRRIKPRGRWNGAGQGWDFPLAAADALQQALGRRFPVTSSLQQWLDWCQQPLPPLPPHRTLVAAADLSKSCRMVVSLCAINAPGSAGSWPVAVLFWPMRWGWGRPSQLCWRPVH